MGGLRLALSYTSARATPRMTATFGRRSHNLSGEGVALDPLRQDAGDGIAVEFPHHGVAIAADAAILEPQLFNPRTGLPQKIHRAVIFGRLPRGLGREHENG